MSEEAAEGQDDGLTPRVGRVTALCLGCKSVALGES